MLIIGLTGGIGSGKSTVSSLFEELGVPIIDADIVAREVVEPGQPALQEIAQTFGAEVINIDGTLNRQQLRKIVFSATEKRKQLETILHPRILADMHSQADKLDTPYCIFAIPLLIETGQQTEVNHVLVIDAEEQIRRARIKKRDELSDDEIEAVLKAQLGKTQRIAAADDIITNNGDINALNEQVLALHNRYLAMAASSH